MRYLHIITVYIVYAFYDRDHVSGSRPLKSAQLL